MSEEAVREEAERAWRERCWREARIAAPFDDAARKIRGGVAAPRFEDVLVCNLCGSERNYQITAHDRYGGYRGQATRSRQCADCGLVWISPRMTAAGYRKFYASGEYRRLVSEYHREEINAETIQADQREYAEWLRTTVLRHRSGWSVLDVGGSTGIVGRAIGAGVTVLDPAGGETMEATGCEVIASTVEDWEPGNRRWEIILVCRSIDHFLDPMGTLRKLFSVLDIGGWLWVDVVDWRSVATERGSIEGAMKLDHPYAFTAETLTEMVKRCGRFALGGPVRRGHHVGYLCG